MSARKRSPGSEAGVPARASGTPALVAAIRRIWEAARTQVARSVNSTLVQANWLIGKQIVEEEQRGRARAAYRQRLLKTLSTEFEAEYGSGFSVSALQYMRAFFLSYPELLSIHHALRGESGDLPSDWAPGRLHPGLSWTHYRTLLKVDRRAARDFYEIETVKNGWSARQLERQVGSLLFFRLLKSRDKQGVLSLANEGQSVVTPIDAVKDPYVLEFLDLPESHRLQESRIEEALLHAAVQWCGHASVHAGSSGGKPWLYRLVPHDAIAQNMTVDGLVRADF